jgi:hypothetical protein
MTAGATDITHLDLQAAQEFGGSLLDCPGTVIYSQPPTWENGLSSQDETWTHPGDPSCYLISQVADDMPGGVITAVRFWGISFQTYTPCPDMGVRVYDDAGGIPGNVVCQYQGPSTCEQVVGYPGAISFEHCVVLAEPCHADAGWIECQALYCRFYTGWGQWYWAVHLPVNGSQVYFLSDFFGFPNWTPGNIVFGDFYDVAFELLNDGSTGTERTSWGEIKHFYR